MRVGDVVCAKSITHREVVEMREGKGGKQRPLVNQYGFKFQGEHNELSTVGVFIFLGTYAEMHGPDKAYEFALSQLRRLGWQTHDDALAAQTPERSPR